MWNIQLGGKIVSFSFNVGCSSLFYLAVQLFPLPAYSQTSKWPLYVMHFCSTISQA